MIVFDSVSKVYPGDVYAVDNLSLEVVRGETLVLLGTSGSGKTTTMKMVNRLIEPTGGSIKIDGKNIMDVDVINLRRNIGYAIQHIGLFPHLTVKENIAIVPQLLKWPAETIETRVESLLEMVGLPPDEFRDRWPAQLSGGQKQRIGVARALAADPPVILMDEPFGALDPITREQLQNEFLELESQIAKTIIFVTHDIFEAVRMGDRIALLDAGKLQQLATPAALVENPANEFVDQFLGQHRFQLSLLTRTVGQLLLEHPPAPEQASGAQPQGGIKARPHLTPSCSLIEALDKFKKTRSNVLPVFRQNAPSQTLAKSQLLRSITAIMNDIQEDS